MQLFYVLTLRLTPPLPTFEGADHIIGKKTKIDSHGRVLGLRHYLIIIHRKFNQ